VLIYHTRWEHRVPYNNTNSTHTHTHAMHTHTLHGCGKDSLEIAIEEANFDDSLKRHGRIRVAEWLRQIVQNRWASIGKCSFVKWFCVYKWQMMLSVTQGSVVVFSDRNQLQILEESNQKSEQRWVCSAWVIGCLYVRHTHTYTHTMTCTCSHTHTHTHTCMFTCTHTHTCMCIHVNMHTCNEMCLKLHLMQQN